MSAALKLPPFLRKYFWDIRFKDLSWAKHSKFIAERVLAFGNMESVNWLLEHFSEKNIKELVNKSRKLDNKTISFWKKILNV